MRNGKAWSLFALSIVLTVLRCAPRSATAAPPVRRLTVHEWGTFTSLQDETGRTIGGINADDEPVPPFVHSLRWDLIIGTISRGALRRQLGVTHRLESTVWYFQHPQGGAWLTRGFFAGYISA